MRTAPAAPNLVVLFLEAAMNGELAAVAFIIAVAIYLTATAWFAHRERMAKIQQGMDPNSKPNPQKDALQ